MSMLKVLVIESDPKTRLTLVNMINADAGMQVVGVASNAMQARMQVNMRKPDLLLLDVSEHGAVISDFLNQMLGANPLPVVFLSRKVLPNTDGERRAIRAGIASILVRPVESISMQNQSFCDQLLKKIKQTMQHFETNYSKQEPAKGAVGRAKPKSATPQSGMQRHRPVLDTLIAIGASTGGTEALRHVISKFPADTNAVVIVQHIPKAFAASLIDKLDRSSPMHVVSAEEGLAVCKGHIYVGAGDEHFTIDRDGQGFVCRVGGKEKVSGHCPSVNALFDSVAKHAGSKAVGAIMTGMGDDGATGLKKMRESRARTIAQDKESSVVWGMPGVAVKIGAAEEQVSLHDLGEKLIRLAR